MQTLFKFPEQTIQAGWSLLKETERCLDWIEQKAYPPDTTPEKLLEYLQALNRQLERNYAEFHDRKWWMRQLISSQSVCDLNRRVRTSGAPFKKRPKGKKKLADPTLQPHTGQQEMKSVLLAKEILDQMFAKRKILSERLCIELRKLQKMIDDELEQNKKKVSKEQKEKARQKAKLKEEAEAELLRAKRNAAW